VVGRKKDPEISTKQLEAYQILLNHVKEFGFQPNMVEMKQLLGVEAPSIRGRLKQLADKGLIDSAPSRAERCVRFKGIKFFAYRVDDGGNPLPDQFEVGDCVVVIKKKGGAK
jgi:hypothetical protein